MTTLMTQMAFAAGTLDVDAATMARAANTLAALGDPVRLRILWSIRAGERNVTALCGLTGKRQQAVSHHLAILRLRRLVVPRRDGKYNRYTLTDAGREALAAALPLLA